MTYDFLLLMLPLVGIFCFFFVIILAACLWEKRPIQSFYVPEKGTAYTPSPLADKANRQAKALDFKYCGLSHDGKGKYYRVRYDFWVSPDLLTFVNIGSGTVAKIPVNGIWFYSRTNDGQILCTTNEIGEQDISGAQQQETWTKYRFDQLLKKHNQRLEGTQLEVFDSDSPLIMYFDIRKRKADALVSRNYAYYLDDEQTVWRYTLKGALVFYFVANWIRPIARGLRSIGLISGQPSKVHN